MAAEHARAAASLQRWLDVTATIAVIAAAGTLSWAFLREELHPRSVEVVEARRDSRPTQVLPDRPIVLAGAATLGSPLARVAIIEYSEFQCPYCGQFANNTFPEVERSLIQTGKVLFAFRHFPLASKHAEALRTAEEADCARRQGKFWEASTLFFQQQAHLKDVTLRSGSLHLDVPSFDSCLAHDAATQVQQDIDSGRKLNITGTPTFIVGDLVGGNLVKARERLVGAQPADRLVGIVDRLVGSRAGGQS
jgi:protein-disulfide isomerase